MRRIGSLPLMVLLLSVSALSVSSSPVIGAPRGRAVAVATGLNAPVGFTFLPNGVLVYAERLTGQIRFRNLTTDGDRRVFRITNVSGSANGGVLGVAIHPNWPNKRDLYVYATRNTSSGLRNQVLRIDLDRLRARIILSSIASPFSDHHGGRIVFGPDGKLYVVIGDDRRAANAQDLSANFRGKVLRINPDGSIPADNPFGTRVWAFGIRNSIGLAFDPLTRKLWQTDNGPECNDEVNRIRKGSNHGWGPNAACPRTNNSGPTPRILPNHTFLEPVGITGLVFCDDCGLGPGVQGDLFVGDFVGGRIRRFDLNGTRNAFDAGPLPVIDYPPPISVLSLEAAPDGRIYFSSGGRILRLVSVS